MRWRAKDLGIKDKLSPHLLRATGITAYLGNGETIKHAQQTAAHKSPRTTKLYDWMSDSIGLDEIERIII